MPTAAQIQAIESYSVDVWGKGNLDAIDDIFHADYVRHGVSLEGEFLNGAQSLKDLVAMFRTAMPDLQVPVADIGGEGDLIFSRWSATGTNTGPMLGVPPTGGSCDVPGFWLHRFDGGKIAEEWAVWDTLAFMQQTGVQLP